VSPDNRGNSDKSSSLPTRKYEPTQNTFNEILTKLVKGRSYAGIFDCWSSKNCQAIVDMPETASSNEQDIRYTLLGPSFFAKYILTLKKDPRHWSGNPRTPKGNCKLII
jgi:hypothetical protein